MGILCEDTGLQLPFAIVTNLEKNIELVTMALQLAKTLAPWYQPKENLIQQRRTVILHPERMKIHPKGNPTIRSTVLPPPLPIETTFQRVGAEKIIFF